MKPLLSKLVSSFNEFNRLLFIIDLKLIYFFADTLVGYFFYIFCIFYGFFGCTGDNCKITHGLAAIFVLFMIGLVIQTYIFMKIPFTRNYFESLVGKDFIEKYLGKYTGSESLIKIFKYLGPAISLMVAETITADKQSKRFLDAAELTEKKFADDCKQRHLIPTDDEYKAMCKVRDQYINKAAHANGVISRSFAAGVSSFYSSDPKN